MSESVSPTSAQQPSIRGVVPFCVNCAYAKKVLLREALECRRRAPRIDAEGGAWWPQIHMHDWCGEHLPRRHGE